MDYLATLEREPRRVVAAMAEKSGDLPATLSRRIQRAREEGWLSKATLEWLVRVLARSLSMLDAAECE